jgi:hypothetical protein
VRLLDFSEKTPLFTRKMKAGEVGRGNTDFRNDQERSAVKARIFFSKKKSTSPGFPEEVLAFGK